MNFTQHLNDIYPVSNTFKTHYESNLLASSIDKYSMSDELIEIFLRICREVEVICKCRQIAGIWKRPRGSRAIEITGMTAVSTYESIASDKRLECEKLTHSRAWLRPEINIRESRNCVSCHIEMWTQ